MKYLRGLGAGVKFVGRGLAALGRGTIALVGLCAVTAALANYTMTQGSGTTFGSIVVGSTHYAQQLMCDYVTPAQCANVKASSTAAAAADQSLVTNESPNSQLSTAAGTTADFGLCRLRQFQHRCGAEGPLCQAQYRRQFTAGRLCSIRDQPEL